MKRTAPRRSTKPIKRYGRQRFRKGIDLAYRAWVRLLPCLIGQKQGTLYHCGFWVTDPAHVQPKGNGGADRWNLVPLCRYHHTEQHAIGRKTFEAKYRVDLKAEALKLLAIYEAKEREAK